MTEADIPSHDAGHTEPRLGQQSSPGALGDGAESAPARRRSAGGRWRRLAAVSRWPQVRRSGGGWVRTSAAVVRLRAGRVGCERPGRAAFATTGVGTVTDTHLPAVTGGRRD